MSCNYSKLNSKPWLSLAVSPIYSTHLSSIEERYNFQFFSFKWVIIGKVTDDGSDENRQVGAFKGGFKIYRMPVPKDAEQPDPVNGMFKGKTTLLLGQK